MKSVRSFNVVLSEQEIEDLLSAVSFFIINYTDSPQTKHAMKTLSDKLFKIKQEEKIK